MPKSDKKNFQSQKRTKFDLTCSTHMIEFEKLEFLFGFVMGIFEWLITQKIKLWTIPK
jgi:hypothetical protein